MLIINKLSIPTIFLTYFSSIQYFYNKLNCFDTLRLSIIGGSTANAKRVCSVETFAEQNYRLS